MTGFFLIIFIVLFIEIITNFFGFLSVGLAMNKFMLIGVIISVASAFYWWISSLSYDDYKLKEKIMKRFFGSDSSGSNSSGSDSGGSNLPAVRELNVYEFTMQQLNEQLLYELTAPKPLIFKGLGNKRLQLDVDRLWILHEYIQATLAIQQSLGDLRVEEAISYEKFEAFSKIQINELKEKVRKSELSLLIIEDQYIKEQTKLRTDVERMKIDLVMLKDSRNMALDNHKMSLEERRFAMADRETVLLYQKNKLEAEEYCMKLKAVSDSSINEKVVALFDKIITELSLDRITPSQVLILVSIFGKGGSNSVDDFETNKKKVEQQIEIMKQDTEILRQESRQKFYETEQQRFKLKKFEMDFDE